MTGTPITGQSRSQALAVVVVVAAAAGAAVTFISLVPFTTVAYHSPMLHVAIETAITLIALFGAALLVGRFMRAPTWPELLLAGALLLLALTNLCFAVVPWITDGEPGSFHTWTPVAGRLLGAAGLAAGALLPAVPVRRPRRALLQTLAAVGSVLVAVGIAGALIAPHLPVGIDPALPPDPSGPNLVGEPVLLACQAISLVLYSIAAGGLIRRARRGGDELMIWFAAAATLGAFSRLNYFLFPSVNSEWVYTGDLLRLAFYMVILAGALREINAYQLQLAEAAVHGERRRIARDLHDGLAQELAFIRSQAHRLRGAAEEPATQIALAAERALDESRQAIATLARPVGASLDSSVAQAAEEIALRDAVELRLQLEPSLDAPETVHEALTRIVREAITNAARHGRARSVLVRLARSDGLRLTIEDDGDGMSSDAPNGRGFGLVSMRERAQALGGRVQVSPLNDRGARVEVWLP